VLKFHPFRKLFSEAVRSGVELTTVRPSSSMKVQRMRMRCSGREMKSGMPRWRQASFTRGRVMSVSRSIAAVCAWLTCAPVRAAEMAATSAQMSEVMAVVTAARSRSPGRLISRSLDIYRAVVRLTRPGREASLA
jgi:hypothetical protein